ncbi:MAG: translocation/assembly module TamB domain-containing protein [Kofleriaceae bacterium]
MLRWLRRIVLATLALVALVVAGVLIALHTDWGRERVRRIVESQLSSVFPGGATIGRLEGSVFGELVARDVKLAAHDGSPMIAIGALHVELALRPLFGKTARVDRLVAEDVALYLPGQPKPPAPDAPEEPDAHDDPAGSGGGWRVELPDLELRRARIAIAAGGEPVTLEEVELAASVAIPPGAPITAVARGRGRWRERGAPFELAVAVRAGDRIEVPVLAAKVGGLAVRGVGLAIDPAEPARSEGTVSIDAPAAALAAVVPGAELPADARVTVVARSAPAGETSVALFGALGDAPVRGWLRGALGDPEAIAVRGIVLADRADLGALSRGAVRGRGDAFAVVVGDALGGPGARFTPPVRANGRIEGAPGDRDDHAFAIVAGTPARAAATTGVASGGRAIAIGSLGVAREGERVVVERAELRARARSFAATVGDRAVAAGRLELAVATPRGQRGELFPQLDLPLAGTLAGSRLVYDDTRIGQVAARLSGRANPEALVGAVDARLGGISSAGTPVGSARVSAHYRRDGSISADVVARLAAAPVVVEAGAVATFGDRIEVALGRHAITLPSGERWIGRGGRAVIDDRAATLRGLHTTNRGGRLDVAADYDLVSGKLVANLDARELAAAAIDPAYRGTTSGRIRIQRRGVRWDGNADLVARGLAVDPGVEPIDGDVRLAIAGRRITLDAAAKTARLGDVQVALEVVGPRDLTDVEGWRRLERGSIRRATVGVRRIDLGAASLPTGGRVEGELQIAGTETRGTLTIQGVHTPVGDVSSEITVAPMDDGEIGATSTAHIAGVGDASLAARIAIPEHPLDPTQWRRLGRGAIRTLSVSIDDVAIDPDKLAAFGIAAPYRGRANLGFALAGGATMAKTTIALQSLEGGPLVEPIDFELEATTDARGTRADGCAFASRAPASLPATLPSAGPPSAILHRVPNACAQREREEGGRNRLLLLELQASLPVVFDRWISAPERVRFAPLSDASITIPKQHVPTLLAMIGRTDIVGGELEGSIAFGGTLGTPTAKGAIAMREVRVAERLEGRKIPVLEELKIDGLWGGSSGSVVVTGLERREPDPRDRGKPAKPPGTLYVSAHGTPADLGSILSRIQIRQFDVAPIAAFLPGALVAAQGTLHADLQLRGVDPSGSLLESLRGTFRVERGRVPLSPTIGTLRDAKADASIDDRGLTLKMTGLLGAGSVALDAKSDGLDLTSIQATMQLKRVSPIGELQPVIDANVAARFRRTPGLWRGSITVRDGSIVLPPGSGSDLLDPDAPSDIYFLDGNEAPLAPRFALGGRPPDRPWLIADLDLGPTKIEAADLFDTRGTVEGQLEILVGGSLGMTGRIDIVRGYVGNIFGRSYQAEGGLKFDGTTDAELGIALVHNFPAMTLTARLTGRLSNPAEPQFESSIGLYSRDQLFGFFLGGDPSGDPAAQSREVATGVTASALSETIGKRVKKVLPFKIDVLRCDPGSSAAGASCTVGRWIGDKFFIAVKSRIEPRANENANDAQFQYYLQRDILIEGVAGDRSFHGADLLWRKRW